MRYISNLPFEGVLSSPMLSAGSEDDGSDGGGGGGVVDDDVESISNCDP